MTPPTGTCPVCNRPGLRLRKNGTIWNHGNNAPWGSGQYRQNCGGAGELPKETTK